MCDQICVIEVPKISSQGSVEAVTSGAHLRVDAPTDCGHESAQDLKAGECEGSQKLSFRSEFSRGCVNRSVSLKCPGSQVRTVSRQSYIVAQERISERICEQIGVVEVPKISSQESVEAVKKLSPGANFWQDVCIHRGY